MLGSYSTGVRPNGRFERMNRTPSSADWVYPSFGARRSSRLTIFAETGLPATVTKTPRSPDRMKKFYLIRSVARIHFNRNRQYRDCHVYSRAGARLIRWVIGCTVQPKRSGDRAAIALPLRAQTS